MTSYCIPVEFEYNGQKRRVAMGPFQHSTERSFALTVSRRAIDDCSSLEQLKPAARNLLEGWAAMQTACQSLLQENLKLRQAMDVKESSLEAADEMLTQAGLLIQQYEQQLKRARKRPWPFG